jgi:ribosomal protein S18 acetylase RimI-like enzyme
LDIRPYRDDDEAAVVDLWNQVLPSHSPHNEPRLSISRKTRHDDGLFLVATLDAEVVGTVIGGYDGHRGWLYSLAVAPQHRRRGIGSALVGRIEEILQERGSVKINLQLRGDNAAVAGFYERLGYTIEDRVSMGKRVFTG